MMYTTAQMKELVNGKHRTENYWQKLNLNVDSTYNGKLAVFANNWYVCNADDIDEMVAELQAIKAMIEVVEKMAH